MSYTNGLDDPTLYFNTKLYTGNSTGSTEQAITGLNFAPDLLWVKQRSGAEWHVLSDAVRGVPKNLYSNSTDAEDTIGYLTSLDTNGFTLSSSTGLNGNGSTYVSWNWKANGAGISNTDGSITSTVSANTTSGFSIVSYTGTGSAATVGHGLGVTPSMYIVKNRSDNDSWGVYHKSLGATQFLRLQGNDASATSSVWWNDTEPTSSVFSVGTAVATNASGENLIAYCFAEKKGFSKFGSYTGNGNSDGTFVYTGFKPSFVLVKRTDTAGYEWSIWDNKRDPFNLADTTLRPNTSESESTIGSFYQIDMLSQGYKFRTSNGDVNASGGTFIYMAFAENPFVTSTGIPTTAR
jgi:hypothetical protein